MDLRFEAANTDSSHPSSLGGHYQYWEEIQTQGYTNMASFLVTGLVARIKAGKLGLLTT